MTSTPQGHPNRNPSVVRHIDWPGDLVAAAGGSEAAGAGTAGARLTQKVLGDPNYAALWRAHRCGSLLEDAGFFDDGLSADRVAALRSDTAVLCTPVGKLLDRMAAGPSASHEVSVPGTGHLSPVVLLCCGSFSPVHKGHLAAMHAARAQLEQSGRRVLAGYLSASHDSYVSVKAQGSAALDAEHRLRLLSLATQDSDWLMVDPWEARYAPCALNFTDVRSRLSAYLARHVGPGLEVVFVFGSDNLGFHAAFAAGPGSGVCVARSALSEDQQAWLAWLRREHPGKDFAVLEGPAAQAASHDAGQDASQGSGAGAGIGADKGAGDGPGNSPRGQHPVQMSSSAVRGGDLLSLPPRCRAYWQTARPAPPLAPGGTPQSKASLGLGRYAVRCDLAAALAHWGVPPEACADFEVSLQALLKAHLPAYLALVELPLAPQLALAAEWMKGRPVLSLDPWACGHAQLQASRQFELADAQLASSRMVARPGAPDLATQCQALPARDWLLVDDDTCSGFTCAKVEALLADKLLESKEGEPRWAFLLPATLPTLPTLPTPDAVDGAVGAVGAVDVVDVVDARDFLLGARHGGLVVRAPTGALVRVPYALPWVDLASRASVPAPSQMSLSAAIWRLNARWFARWLPHAQLQDVAGQAAPFFAQQYPSPAQQSAPPEDLLASDFCLQMERWLQGGVSS